MTVAANAPGVVSNAPKYVAHGQSWANIDTDPISVGVPADGDVGGTVPATLSLALGGSATFGAFVPGVDRDYTASTTATVISTAGDAALTCSGPDHLANGAFTAAVAARGRLGAEDLVGARVERERPAVVQAAHRRVRRAAHRRLLDDPDLDAVDDDPVARRKPKAHLRGLTL